MLLASALSWALRSQRSQRSLATREGTAELQLPILRTLAGGFQSLRWEEKERGIREEAGRRLPKHWGTHTAGGFRDP